MLVLDNLQWLDMPLPWSGGMPGLWAYFGLGPGQELIPYFLGLLAFAGAALVAVLQWPLLALRRFFARRKRDSKLEPPADTLPPSQADDPAGTSHDDGRSP